MSSRHAGNDRLAGNDGLAGHDRSAGRNGLAGRGSFRAWRRSRPFWGGLLLVLAGLELLAIPLSGVLVKGQVKLVIYIGIGGVFGVLIGALLIAAGIVMWVNPAHRVFYGVAGIVMGLISFMASNLGGFFLGMLLAIVGGAMAFAWTPTGQREYPVRPASRAQQPPLVPAPDGDDGDDGDEGPGWPERYGAAGTGGAGGIGQRMLALTVMPAMIVAGMTGAAHQASFAKSGGDCIFFGLICSPGSGPSASPSPSGTTSGTTSGTASGSGTGSGSGATPSPSPSASGLLPSLPLPSGTASPGASPGPGTANTANGNAKNGKSAKAQRASAPAGLVAPSATAMLTATSATMDKLDFVGVATLPLGGGGSEQALKFTASSAAMSGVELTVTEGGSSVVTKTTSLDFGGDMTLYTTKLCGQVYGITPNICFTPSTASEVALKLASVLGQAAPIKMTSVTTDQFVVSAGTMRWGALSMSAA